MISNRDNSLTLNRPLIKDSTLLGGPVVRFNMDARAEKKKSKGRTQIFQSKVRMREHPGCCLTSRLYSVYCINDICRSYSRPKSERERERNDKKTREDYHLANKNAAVFS